MARVRRDFPDEGGTRTANRKDFKREYFENEVEKNLKEFDKYDSDLCLKSLSDKGRAVEPFATARNLLATRAVLERICPAIRNVSDDVAAIASSIVSALVPLALEEGSEIPLNLILFAGIAVIVSKVKAERICAEIEF
jgi:hypothetical protein